MPPRPRVVGTGPRHVLAMHGWFGCAAGWGPFAELLDGDRYSVAYVDYRGYGARRGEPGDFSLAEIAADALAAAPAFRHLGRPDGAVLPRPLRRPCLRRLPGGVGVHRFLRRGAGHPVPVLVVVGEHDPALGAPVMQQTFLEQYPNASLEVLPNAGHYAMFETPVALLTCVERFLDGL